MILQLKIFTNREVITMKKGSIVYFILNNEVKSGYISEINTTENIIHIETMEGHYRFQGNNNLFLTEAAAKKKLSV